MKQKPIKPRVKRQMQGKGSKKSLEKFIVRTHNGRGKDIS